MPETEHSRGQNLCEPQCEGISNDFIFILNGPLLPSGGGSMPDYSKLHFWKRF